MMKKLFLKTLATASFLMAMSFPALAADGTGGGTYKITLGALAVGIAAVGCGLGDGNAIAAACEGTARNPGAGQRIFTTMLIGMVLIETLVLFTFLAAFLGF
ncbi:MAG: ATP synthase F0 subunit C [Chloracidobacterium sp.]|nr:ATP synthase F0 subunit C [Chloracidobacterium sp.]MDW8218402.1 ATP synthase F0 subunit C [Acidobacteriota bacterium]